MGLGWDFLYHRRGESFDSKPHRSEQNHGDSSLPLLPSSLLICLYGLTTLIPDLCSACLPTQSTTDYRFLRSIFVRDKPEMVLIYGIGGD
jgi:hypothetical protein